jgi:hypothetical protein
MQKGKGTSPIGREEMTILHRGRAEALELIKKCNLPTADPLHELLTTRIMDMISDLPNQAFAIKFKLASLSWTPEQEFTKRDGIRDKLAKEASYGLLPDHLILLLAAIGKIKEPIVSLISTKDRYLHIEVNERKTNFVSKFLKSKIERKISSRFLPYGLSKHSPAKAVFGTIEVHEVNYAEKLPVEKQLNFQHAQLA